MSLFSLKDISVPIPEDEKSYPAIRNKGKNRFALAPKNSILRDVIGQIDHDENIHVPSRSNWSSHDLIEYLIEQTGPVDVWLTSWSVKEQALRNLILLIEKKNIKSLTCLFDERIKVQCPQAHQLAARNVVNMKLMKIHAKAIVLINENWGISVTTSANLTRNPRVEKYVICTDRATAYADRDWIEAELLNANPFEL